MNKYMHIYHGKISYMNFQLNCKQSNIACFEFTCASNQIKSKVSSPKLEFPPFY